MRKFVQVEYDKDYYGGDYGNVGDFFLLPEDGLTDENLPERFRKATSLDPIHIIHYTLDDVYDWEGNLLDE